MAMGWELKSNDKPKAVPCKIRQLSDRVWYETQLVEVEMKPIK